MTRRILCIGSEYNTSSSIEKEKEKQEEKQREKERERKRKRRMIYETNRTNTSGNNEEGNGLNFGLKN